MKDTRSVAVANLNDGLTSIMVISHAGVEGFVHCEAGIRITVWTSYDRKQ